MTDWQRTLDIKDAWTKASEDEISSQELAKVITSKLRSMKPLNDMGIDDQREEIADWFEDFSDDEEASTDDFDCLMTELYDWADIKISGDFFNAKKVCWVKTL